MKYSFIDFETANSARESICAVGISVHENGVETDSFYSLVKPKPLELDRSCFDVHKIELCYLLKAPDFITVYSEIKKRLDGIVVAHNAAFDMNCFAAALNVNEIPYPDFFYLDTLKIARTRYKHAKLSDLTETYGVPYENAHNALADARMLGKIYWKMRDDFGPEICEHYMEHFESRNDEHSEREKISYNFYEPELTTNNLPFAEPEKIEFEGRKFVVTGVFASISRKYLEDTIRRNGGIIQTTANTKTDYIIIGSIASNLWVQGNFGRKIESALKHPNVVFIAEATLQKYPEFVQHNL